MPATLNLFIRLLKYLGLMSVSFDSDPDGYKIRNHIAFYVYHAIIQLMLMLSFVLLIWNKSIFPQMELMDTGNFYNYMALQTACLTFIILNFWLILKQREHLHLLKVCKQWSDEYLQIEMEMYPLYPRTRLVTFIIAVIFYSYNVVQCVRVNIAVHSVTNYLPWLMYTYRFVTSTTLSSIFLEMVMIVKNTLKYVSHSCKQLLNSNSIAFRDSDLYRLEELLNLHDEIKFVASEQIDCVYGVIILLCSFNMVLETICIFYFMAISTIDKQLGTSHLLVIFNAMKWTLPLVVFWLVGFFFSDMSEKADKTAKILAKCPRGNSGVDKMISKFLLKNLRQKPILTAYGFFSLDKSTLFKLFTAVFTYMVILVQFKEMESNTKKISSDNS